jgi:hypothetical protein
MMQKKSEPCKDMHVSEAAKKNVETTQ